MPYKPKISFTMIVKNEEANLEKALKSVEDMVDEIIIVDTGSTDKTKEIANRFGAKIYDYPWKQHFGDARNETLKYTTGDWILWLDGDEYFDEVNRAKIKKLIAGLKDENVVYMFTQVNTVDRAPGETILFSRPSLFRNDPRIRWRYRVHEQIIPAIQESGGQVISTDIELCHPGYHVESVHKAKVERNIRLLHMEDNENPNDPLVLFHIGLMYQSVNRYAEAIPWWPKALQFFHPSHPLAAKSFFLWANGLAQLGSLEEALKVCVEGRKRYPNHPELLIQHAQLLAQIGRLQEAEQLLYQLIEIGKQPKEAYTGSFNTSVYDCFPHSLLGEIYRISGRIKESEAQFKEVLAINPQHKPSLEGLCRLYHEQGRFEECAQLRDLINSIQP